MAMANAGESLDELSKRTGNVWKTAYTALVNNIPRDKKLEVGELIKIAMRLHRKKNGH